MAVMVVIGQKIHDGDGSGSEDGGGVLVVVMLLDILTIECFSEYATAILILESDVFTCF